MSHAATILIVDDDERCRSLLTSMLASEGYRLLTADNGQEAFAYAVSHRPDVVLLDVMMPDMDGFEVCRLLRSDRTLTHLPIIFTTALDDKKSRLKGIEAGADDFVTKPIDIMELRTRLRSITRLNRFRLLSEERARFEQVVAASPDGIVITDTRGRIHMANTAFHALFERGIIPENFYDELQSDDLNQLRALLPGEGDNRARVCPFSVRLKHLAGTDLELSFAGLPWDGQPAYQFCVRDITEKKLLENQLLRSQRIDLLGQLAGSVIHDVNNLLSSIAAHAALIGMGGDAEETAKRLAAIETSAFHGGGLLRQLLMFARGNDGDMEELDSVSQIFEFHTMVQQTLGEKIQVVLDVPHPVPAFVADGNQIHQVLMNLCVNARDAMGEQGTVTLRLEQVTVGLRELVDLPPEAKEGPYIRYQVRDTGPGIPPEVRPKLFEPFFTTKAKDKGTGLGLATVLRVMKRHHGFITLETSPTTGTCFSCYFPCQAQNPTAESSQATLAHTSS